MERALSSTSRKSFKKKSPEADESAFGLFEKIFGGVLLSHTASHAVPSALKSLTSVFGMVTGVSSSPSPPKNRFTIQIKVQVRLRQ